jgi:exoribonuclease II
LAALIPPWAQTEWDRFKDWYEKEEGWRLPTFQELRNIMQYLANNPAFLQKAEWSNQNAIYISQEIRFDNRNNRLLKGILLTGNTITTNGY